MRQPTEIERLATDLYTGRCRAGREAAREVAARITEQHGFWDYEERKRACEIRNAQPVAVLGGENPSEFPVGLRLGGETPQLAA